MSAILSRLKVLENNAPLPGSFFDPVQWSEKLHEAMNKGLFLIDWKSGKMGSIKEFEKADPIRAKRWKDIAPVLASALLNDEAEDLDGEDGESALVDWPFMKTLQKIASTE